MKYSTISHGTVCLGMIPSVPDKRTMKLTNYLKPSALPPLKKAVDFYSRVPYWGAALNDQYGCCTISGLVHGIQVWSEYAKLTEETVPDATVKDVYFNLTGGVDSGLMELDVLKYINKMGFGGIEIDGFASIDPKDHDLRDMAIQLCGFTYIGVMLPVTAQDQTWWHVVDPQLQGTSAPGTWGGHCVINPGFNREDLSSMPGNMRGTVATATWGKVMGMDDAFWDAYVSECWVMLSKEWMNAAGTNPDGIDWKTLNDDVEKVARYSQDVPLKDLPSKAEAEKEKAKDSKK